MAKAVLFLMLVAVLTAQGQYISEIVEYQPAPGQLINTATVGGPSAANENLSASIVGRLTGVLSLGAFGGNVVFKFAEPVQNHHDNPYGVDFVIYGNPMPNSVKPENGKLVSWAEPGIVWVMADENQNGLPDDTWYELAGSDYFFASTQKHYSVTYTNPNSASNVKWKDNQENTGEILVNEFHTQPYYPLADSFPSINNQQYTLSGTKLGVKVDRSNAAYVNLFGRAWGYVDNTLKHTYNGLPDNPYTPNVVENSGGDAFDINWAVDTDGQYVNLETVDFIKVQNAVLAHAGWLGEVSTELAGAFVVSPNAGITGITDMVVVNDLPDTIYVSPFALEAVVYHQGRRVVGAEIDWQVDQQFASINNQNELHFTESGKVQIIARQITNLLVADTLCVYLNTKTATEAATTEIEFVEIAPNPATNSFTVIGIEEAYLTIYNQQGYLVKAQSVIGGEYVDIEDFPNGIYIVTIKGKSGSKKVKLVK